MSDSLSHNQNPDKAILDINGKQTYLGESFIVGLDATNSATTETPLLLLSNPSTNIKSMFIFVKKMTALTATHSAQFRFYYNPTVTANGTAKTPVNLKTGSSYTSVMKVYSGPTISNNGTFLAMLATTGFSADISTLLQIIDPGGALLITGTVSNANDQINCEVAWNEQ